MNNTPFVRQYSVRQMGCFYMSEKRKAYLLLQQLSGFGARRRVHRVLSADACKIQGFVGTQTVKLDPCVFPRLLFIGTVGGDLTGSDQKTLPVFSYDIPKCVMTST